MSYLPLRHYGIIGNLRTAALVGKNASIDWLPTSVLASPSMFASILDVEQGGNFKIELDQEIISAEQIYEENTNILVTTLTTQGGLVKITDFMPVMPYVPANYLMRRIQCAQGVCNLTLLFHPRFDYARGSTQLALVQDGVKASHVRGRARVRSEFSWNVADDRAEAHLNLKTGDTVYVQLMFGERIDDYEVKENVAGFFTKHYRATKDYWQTWLMTQQPTIDIPAQWRASVNRSLLTLKLLFSEPHNTMAAAATTSLPELIGGVRNWDYRFNWIRDTSFALQALLKLGYTTEAIRYWQWFSQECAPHFVRAPHHLQCIYGLQGEHEVGEELLEHLSGYQSSKPVRIGNGAFRQKQWDNYGSLLDMLWSLYEVHPIAVINVQTWQIIKSLADHVMKVWQKADEGIWEIRDKGRHFVYSKVMCWVALDRASRFANVFDFPAEAARWNRAKQQIYRMVMERGWNEQQKSFAQSFDSPHLDASVLRMPAVGFIGATHPRMLSTIARLEEELSIERGYLRRYKNEDGLPGSEGAFIILSFWLIDALILAGQTAKADLLLQKLNSAANHVGLYAEEIDPVSKEFLGNFPQAYSHTGFLGSVAQLAQKNHSGSPIKLHEQNQVTKVH